jgi:hypothetical protein
MYDAPKPAAREKLKVRPVHRGRRGNITYPIQTFIELSQMGPELKEMEDMTG